MRPENATADSEFEAILRVGGLTHDKVDRFRLEQGIPEVDLSAYCAIIAGGSPFDVTTPEAEKGPVQQSVEAFFTELFNRIVPIDFHFLGCCSGNGLLGRHYGAPNT